MFFTYRNSVEAKVLFAKYNGNLTKNSLIAYLDKYQQRVQDVN